MMWLSLIQREYKARFLPEEADFSFRNNYDCALSWFKENHSSTTFLQTIANTVLYLDSKTKLIKPVVLLCRVIQYTAFYLEDKIFVLLALGKIAVIHCALFRDVCEAVKPTISQILVPINWSTLNVWTNKKGLRQRVWKFLGEGYVFEPDI